MESTAAVEGRRRRLGGRTAEVTDRVNQAVLSLLVEGGMSLCTYSNVAARAGVERSTLYRRYADQWEMMIDAFMALAADEVMPDSTGSFAGDLRSVLKKLAARMATPVGPALVAAAAELRAGSGPDFSRAYFATRMAQLRPMFDAAMRRGELPVGTDKEELFSMAAGPIYFRMFIAGRPIEDDFIDRIVERVCRSFCVPS